MGIRKNLPTVSKRQPSEAVSWILCCAIVSAAIVQVITTYTAFNHTYDEPVHIYAGVRYISSEEYGKRHRETPPLARLLLGLGPYIAGARPVKSSEEFVDLGVLYANDAYGQILSFARLGNLPFLLLLLAATCAWAKYLFGIKAAVVSILTLATLPPVLGHAGLATTDIACAATVLATLYILLRWIDSRAWHLAAAFGLSAGVAIMVKFSAIPFLVSSMIGLFLWRTLFRDHDGMQRLAPRKCAAQLSFSLAVMIGVFWFSYALFDSLQTTVIHEKFDAGDLRKSIAEVAGERGVVFEMIRYALTEFPVPVFVRDMATGLKMLSLHNENGHWGYLLGETSRDGWWYYYFIELAVKTPIPLLLLGSLGFACVMRISIVRQDWRIATPVVCFAAILIFVCVASRINTGVRHILILYPLIALTVGALIAELTSRHMHGAVALSGALLLWQMVGSVAAHPDYISHFNLLAGAHPERILIDSDLDWGQDLKRLEKEILERNIERISIAYYGSADLNQHIPNHEQLKPFQSVSGWVAVSLTLLATPGSGYEWLAEQEPVTRVGQSINLYFIAPDPAKAS